jgi:hypothetical protein
MMTDTPGQEAIRAAMSVRAAEIHAKINDPLRVELNKLIAPALAANYKLGAWYRQSDVYVILDVIVPFIKERYLST